MADLNTTVHRASRISRGAAPVLEQRLTSARKRYTGRRRSATSACVASVAMPKTARACGQDACRSSVYAAPRLALFGLTHEPPGDTPLLDDEYEMPSDGRCAVAAEGPVR